jgi:hypothetical protein
VRTIARDLGRQTYTRSAFQPDVVYEDGYRSFKGAERLSRAVWSKDVVKDAKVVGLGGGCGRGGGPSGWRRSRLRLDLLEQCGHKTNTTRQRTQSAHITRPSSA